jgi:beta-galactosidase
LGKGKDLGPDCGNPADPEPNNSGQRMVFNGLGLVLIQVGKIPGKITLTASCESIKDVLIEITTK